MPDSPEPLLPASPAHSREEDSAEMQERLDLLSIFHFIHAGLSLFLLLIPAYLLILSHVFLSNPPHNAPPQLKGIMEAISVTGGVLAVLIILFVGVIAEAGFELRRRRRYRFCFAVAVIQSLHLPYGTVLGVFTIVALHKPKTKQLFGVGTDGK